jgi:hypothetical protein
VALDATTGWRFVADELHQVGATVHLAEPAETAACRGNKKHAKSDRADARHIHELLTIGRLPEPWIPPDHLLDLRAKVRLRHTLSHQRGEWHSGSKRSCITTVSAARRVADREWSGLAGYSTTDRLGARADHRRAGSDRRAR